MHTAVLPYVYDIEEGDTIEDLPGFALLYPFSEEQADEVLSDSAPDDLSDEQEVTTSLFWALDETRDPQIKWEKEILQQLSDIADVENLTLEDGIDFDALNKEIGAMLEKEVHLQRH